MKARQTPGAGKRYTVPGNCALLIVLGWCASAGRAGAVGPPGSEDARYARISRRIFPRLREVGRDGLVRELAGTVSKALKAAPGASLQEAVSAAEQLGVLLADEATPILRRAASLTKKEDSWRLVDAACWALLEIQLSHFGTPEEKLGFALKRVLSLPSSDPEGQAFEIFVDNISRRNPNNVVLSTVVELVRAGELNPADKRLPSLTGGIYLCANDRTLQYGNDRESATLRILELHFDPSPAVRRLADNWTVYLLVTDAAFSPYTEYPDVTFHNAVLSMASASLEKQNEIAEIWPVVRGCWDELKAALRESIKRTLSVIKSGQRRSTARLADIEARLEQGVADADELEELHRAARLLRKEAAWNEKRLRQISKVLENEVLGIGELW